MDHTIFKQQLIHELKHEYTDKYITEPEDVFLPGHKERMFISMAFLDVIKIVEDFKPQQLNKSFPQGDKNELYR